METCFSQPIILYCYTKNLSRACFAPEKTEIFVLFCYTLFMMDKFEVKKKKKNDPTLVQSPCNNIMQEIKKEIHQECFILTLSSCFDRLANTCSVIFVSLSCKKRYM